MSIRHVARRGLRRAYEALGDHEVALPLTLVLTPESTRGRWVSRGTDLVVEGFPRSGNTFAALSIAMAQGEGFELRSHAHSPAQVKRAARLRVPTLVVVRDPADAVCSMAVADEHHRTQDLLRYWIHYHGQVMALRDDVVIAPFASVTGDLPAVVRSLEDRYGLDLTIPPAEGSDAVFAAIEDKQRRVHGAGGYVQAVPRPDPGRRAALAARHAELEATVPAATIDQALSLHDDLVER